MCYWWKEVWIRSILLIGMAKILLCVLDVLTHNCYILICQTTIMIKIFAILHTVCLRSSDPFYVVTYNIKWVTTSWTLLLSICWKKAASIRISRKFILHKYYIFFSRNHGFYIKWLLISRCARMMKTRSFSEKKIGFDDSFDVTKCL